jgi:hypothetical protein
MSYVFTPLQLAWIEAIKSGRFLQGRERLTSLIEGKQYHCCLGVACIIHNEQAEALKLRLIELTQRFDAINYNNERNYAPNALIDALGLRGNAGQLKKFASINGLTYDTLAEMNDNGMSFVEIAAYIEANPENVFLTN